MNVFIIIMRVISLTLLASTLICGLYLAAQGAGNVEISSLQFHKAIGIAAVASGAVTMFLPGKKVKQ